MLPTQPFFVHLKAKAYVLDEVDTGSSRGPYTGRNEYVMGHDGRPLLSHQVRV